MTEADKWQPGRDRRDYPRVDSRKRVTVTVVAAPEAPQIESRTYYCWTQDLSASGLRFCVHSKVPVGAILKLEVLFEDPRESFRHIGIVVWKRDVEEDGIVSTWMGIRITDTLGGAMRFGLWRQFVEAPLQFQTS